MVEPPRIVVILLAHAVPQIVTQLEVEFTGVPLPGTPLWFQLCHSTGNVPGALLLGKAGLLLLQVAGLQDPIAVCRLLLEHSQVSLEKDVDMSSVHLTDLACLVFFHLVFGD